MNSKTEFFQVGGTLEEEAPCYIERPADKELLEALDRGELCLVLAPRQTGKSSLMVNARARLRTLGVLAAIVDLQPLRIHHDPDKWFSDIVYQIERSLDLETDATEWWEAHKRLGPTQRFMTFVEDVILGEIERRVVIFFDEIDSGLSLPFSDDFFTTIRALFNARASNPVLKRLTFVLLGVATPSEFIKDRTRTPFNIGRNIALNDFDSASLAGFVKVLGPDSKPLIDRIFYWTDGQPLMVQKLSEAVHSQPPTERSIEKVDDAVRAAYLDTKIEKDTHLKFIRDYLLEGYKKVRKTLSTYKAVIEGKEVSLNDQSPIHSRLKLAGVVRVEDLKLVPRTRIYPEVFDPKWIKENTPRNVTKMVAYGASAALVLVLLWFLVIQPFYFPKFTRFQTLYWQTEDIFYTEGSTFKFDFPLPAPGDQVATIKMNGEKIADESRKPNSLQITFENLSAGPNRYRLRFYGGLWKENFTSQLVVVSYPMSDWKPLSDLKMVEVNEGCFDMGCGEWGDECFENEKPVHKVCLDGFEIGKYEVTQDQWENIMGYNPSFFKKGEDYPVENISWNDIQDFIGRLNKISGDHYRLLTEAEWEYAARSGGRKEKYAGGSDLDSLGWYSLNSNSQTHAAGQKRPNGLDIYDMSGNVWEWCADWYDGDFYKNSPTDNPKGPETGVYRVIRGGSWYVGARLCRSAFRLIAPGNRRRSVGFRLARSVTLDP